MDGDFKEVYVITERDITYLRAQAKRTGIVAGALLARSANPPKGLTPVMVARWFSETCEEKFAERAHVVWFYNEYAKTPSASASASIEIREPKKPPVKPPHPMRGTPAPKKSAIIKPEKTRVKKAKPVRERRSPAPRIKKLPVQKMPDQNIATSADRIAAAKTLRHLLAEIRRTSVAPEDIAKTSGPHASKSLFCMAAGLRKGSLETAKPAHLVYMKEAYAKLEDKVRVSNNLIEATTSMPKGPLTLTEIFTQEAGAPPGLWVDTAQIFLLRGYAFASRSWPNWLTQTFQKTGAPSDLDSLAMKRQMAGGKASPGFYKWTEADREDLRARIEQTGVHVGSFMDKKSRKFPAGLTTAIAEKLISGELRESPKAYLPWLKEMYTRIAAMQAIKRRKAAKRLEKQEMRLNA